MSTERTVRAPSGWVMVPALREEPGERLAVAGVAVEDARLAHLA